MAGIVVVAAASVVVVEDETVVVVGVPKLPCACTFGIIDQLPPPPEN